MGRENTGNSPVTGSEQAAKMLRVAEVKLSISEVAGD
jgi:hypothetical protein